MRRATAWGRSYLNIIYSTPAVVRGGCQLLAALTIYPTPVILHGGRQLLVTHLLPPRSYTAGVRCSRPPIYDLPRPSSTAGGSLQRPEPTVPRLSSIDCNAVLTVLDRGPAL